MNCPICKEMCKYIKELELYICEDCKGKSQNDRSVK